ncbi:HAD family hydrolase [Nocardioides flavescens]|uniref:HAD-IA family hydrolase n=1 Tax=Nocardioides flavescens TaxID=2691959 RepID=A0A6L7F3D3_9ACTN|nr:HAD family hydrolase [Nocardioides flavescens]MXG91735.1 HAD-IA family hydrolase [Nocardioides flavescens]
MSADPTVVLDVDGTLVDTNYHHVLAWSRAFAAHDVTVPLWRVHRAIGMGGDRLVGEVAGDDVEERLGDEVRARWKDEFDAVIDEVRPLVGARELLAALKDRGVAVALASSANPEHAHHAFALLGVDEGAEDDGLVDTATSAEDAGESKPDPELVQAALDRLGQDLETGAACVVGDSVHDVRAAQRAGLPAYAVLTGGTSRAELLEAGAAGVYVDLDDLREHLEEWLPR